MQTDGKIVIGGNFTTMGGMTRKHVARLNTDGTLDIGFNPNLNDWVYSTAVQTDGKILIGGDFTAVGGVARSYIARLNADGTADTNFNANVNGSVYITTIQADGKTVIAGDFTTVGGVARNYIARLNTDGTLDTGFDPNANTGVYCIAVQTDGKIVIGGGFTIVGSVARNYIARLNADGTADTSFNPNASSYVYTAVVQADGKVVIAGEFTAVGGVTRNRIARLNADGTLDTGFNPNANSAVYTTIMQTDGKVVIGGSFTTVGGVARNYIGRLNSIGTLDTSFNPNANSYVYSTAVQADGKIVLGGDFSTVGGVARNYIARLDNDAATQSLTVPSANRVQWLRGGTAPDTLQVIFDLSTNGGITWIPLGNGNRGRLIGGWEKTGISLPSAGQVRARARTIGGYSNGSSGLVEAVTAFSGLPVPVVSEIAVEQPALTDIPDGGSRSFGNVLVGTNNTLTYTIKNIGNADLTGLGITIDGTNAADFTLITNATSLVTGPSGSTTFTVRFTPTATGAKTAALHIASNDPDENPFDINFSGRGLAPNADDDGDGVINETEVNLGVLGFDSLVNNGDLLVLLSNNALSLGLYRASDVQSLALGVPLLQKNPTNGHFYLSLAVENSSTLGIWAPLTNITPNYDALTGKITLEITPDAANAQFYRVLGGKP